jgi:hypothetical protein
MDVSPATSVAVRMLVGLGFSQEFEDLNLTARMRGQFAWGDIYTSEHMFFDNEELQDMFLNNDSSGYDLEVKIYNIMWPFIYESPGVKAYYLDGLTYKDEFDFRLPDNPKPCILKTGPVEVAQGDLPFAVEDEHPMIEVPDKVGEIGAKFKVPQSAIQTGGNGDLYMKVECGQLDPHEGGELIWTKLNQQKADIRSVSTSALILHKQPFAETFLHDFKFQDP